MKPLLQPAVGIFQLWIAETKRTVNSRFKLSNRNREWLQEQLRHKKGYLTHLPLNFSVSASYPLINFYKLTPNTTKYHMYHIMPPER